MVDPGLLLHGHLGEDVAGEERLGEALGLVLVLPHALDEREVVLELLRGHERRRTTERVPEKTTALHEGLARGLQVRGERRDSSDGIGAN